MYMPHDVVTHSGTHCIDFIRPTICTFYFHNSKFAFKLILKGFLFYFFFLARLEAYESGNLIVVLAYALPMPKPIDKEPPKTVLEHPLPLSTS